MPLVATLLHDATRNILVQINPQNEPTIQLPLRSLCTLSCFITVFVRTRTGEGWCTKQACVRFDFGRFAWPPNTEFCSKEPSKQHENVFKHTQNTWLSCKVRVEHR